MCEWADGLEGIDSAVSFLEHHGSPDGYMPSPILFASAVAGRTRRMTMSVVLLAPFYHPIRLAEDLAVLDLISRGRVTFLLAAGYRREEFAALGVDRADRGRLMEEVIGTLKKAWTGEPFEFRGKPVLVTPRPYRQPRPPILMGGSSKAAALRAARMADGFAPTSPAVMQTYRDEKIALGMEPGPAPPGGGGVPLQSLIAVSEDPDATWKEVGPYCLHEMNSYAAWLRDASAEVSGYWEVAGVDELRATGRYLVLTPDQCVERARAQGGALGISPLTGGIAPELGWRSLKLIETEVLPRLK
jgi:alkanesulfonate monooxygenase SsuD/methylene tetrahydromethanopterin reductase-like flavin-dependent oxidoreductase (luciferase family)